MELTELEKRIRSVLHKNRRVLLFDFTRLTSTSDALEVIQPAKKIIAGQSEHSVFTLTDIIGSDYDRDVASALQDLAKHNKPYVIAGAAVGVSGLQKVVFRSILAFSGRKNIQLFDTREEALDWLATYASKEK